MSIGLPGGFRLKPVLYGMTFRENLVDLGQLAVFEASPGHTGGSKNDPLKIIGLST